MCSTHMLQVYVPSVSFVFRRMLHLNFFMLQVFYVVQPGVSPRDRRKVRTVRWGAADGAARGVRTGAPIGGTSVLALKYRPCGEREERVWECLAGVDTGVDYACGAGQIRTRVGDDELGRAARMSARPSSSTPLSVARSILPFSDKWNNSNF
jgi:hypothetical protein